VVGLYVEYFAVMTGVTRNGTATIYVVAIIMFAAEAVCKAMLLKSLSDIERVVSEKLAQGPQNLENSFFRL
jgi:hypothetical protein